MLTLSLWSVIVIKAVSVLSSLWALFVFNALVSPWHTPWAASGGGGTGWGQLEEAADWGWRQADNDGGGREAVACRTYRSEKSYTSSSGHDGQLNTTSMWPCFFCILLSAVSVLTWCSLFVPPHADLQLFTKNPAELIIRQRCVLQLGDTPLTPRLSTLPSNILLCLTT